MNGGLIIVVSFQMAHVLKKILIIMEMMSNHYMPLIQVLVRWNARLMKIVSFGLIIHYQMAEIWIVGWNLVTVSHQWNPIGSLALNTVVIITWLRLTYPQCFIGEIYCLLVMKFLLKFQFSNLLHCLTISFCQTMQKRTMYLKLEVLNFFIAWLCSP